MFTKEAEANVTHKSDKEYETCENIIHGHLTPHGRLAPPSPTEAGKIVGGIRK